MGKTKTRKYERVAQAGGLILAVPAVTTDLVDIKRFAKERKTRADQTAGMLAAHPPDAATKEPEVGLRNIPVYDFPGAGIGCPPIPPKDELVKFSYAQLRELAKLHLTKAGRSKAEVLVSLLLKKRQELLTKEKENDESRSHSGSGKQANSNSITRWRKQKGGAYGGDSDNEEPAAKLRRSERLGSIQAVPLRSSQLTNTSASFPQTDKGMTRVKQNEAEARTALSILGLRPRNTPPIHAKQQRSEDVSLKGRFIVPSAGQDSTVLEGEDEGGRGIRTPGRHPSSSSMAADASDLVPVSPRYVPLWERSPSPVGPPKPLKHASRGSRASRQSPGERLGSLLPKPLVHPYRPDPPINEPGSSAYQATSPRYVPYPSTRMPARIPNDNQEHTASGRHSRDPRNHTGNHLIINTVVVRPLEPSLHNRAGSQLQVGGLPSREDHSQCCNSITAPPTINSTELTQYYDGSRVSNLDSLVAQGHSTETNLAASPPITRHPANLVGETVHYQQTADSRQTREEIYETTSIYQDVDELRPTGRSWRRYAVAARVLIGSASRVIPWLEGVRAADQTADLGAWVEREPTPPYLTSVHGEEEEEVEGEEEEECSDNAYCSEITPLGMLPCGRRVMISDEEEEEEEEEPDFTRPYGFDALG